MKETRNFKKGYEIPYTQVPNEILYDPTISLKAKALWAYMNAKPDGWFFAADRIAEECSDGAKGVRSGLKELLEAGLLDAKKQQNGRFVYTLKMKSFPQGFPQEDPANCPKGDLGGFANCPKGKQPKGQIDKKATIINKESNKKRDKEIDAGLADNEPASGLTRKQLLEMEYQS
jgi:hypothetical protein